MASGKKIDATTEQAEDTGVLAEQAKAEGQTAETRLCPCGCGEPILGKKAQFAPGGHDMKHKSALLARHDAGDDSATTELIDRGWRTAEELALRRAKGAEVGAAKAERLRAKLTRIDAQLASLKAEKATVETELAGLVG